MTRLIFLALALIVAAGAAPPAPSVPHSACAPPPALDTTALGNRRQAAVRIVGNFNAAYRQACLKGVLSGRRLIKPGSVRPGTLFLLNAPDANVASIYNDGEPGGRLGRMVLEFPFVTADRRVHVPGVADLEEAIFCAVQGATEAETEEEGRCLPD